MKQICKTAIVISCILVTSEIYAQKTCGSLNDYSITIQNNSSTPFSLWGDVYLSNNEVYWHVAPAATIPAGKQSQSDFCYPNATPNESIIARISYAHKNRQLCTFSVYIYTAIDPNKGYVYKVFARGSNHEENCGIASSSSEGVTFTIK